MMDIKKSLRKLPYQTLSSLSPLKLKLRDGLIMRRMYNNTFCNEYCVRCKRSFHADLTHIWGIGQYQLEGYICYKCADDLANHCKFHVKEKIKVILI